MVRREVVSTLGKLRPGELSPASHAYRAPAAILAGLLVASAALHAIYVHFVQGPLV